MAKIDCSQAANFIRESKRMCEYYRHDCDRCPMSIMNNGYGGLCAAFIEQHPETAVEIVQKWSDEHSVKTRLDDLLEKYPKVYISSGNTPSIRPYMLGYCENCDDCVYSHCEASECWHEPVNGGATGRAVE